MQQVQSISWIFLAIALASQTGAAAFSSISTIADGINHAVPTHKEMQTSILFLTTNEFVRKQGKKYELTTKGDKLYQWANEKSKTLLEIWKNLTGLLESQTN
jgi:hypothetical protein